MTNEQIEAIADRLRTLMGYFCQAVEMEDGAKAGAMDDIEALCAAARQDSLVGKRVRCEQIDGPAVVVAENMDCTGEMAYTLLPWNEESHDWKLFRDGFELLEGDDAK